MRVGDFLSYFSSQTARRCVDIIVTWT